MSGRQPPQQAKSRAHLREFLSVKAGGVVSSTIQKLLPEKKGDRHPTLSHRRNIVVIVDEAHRSDHAFIAGFARHIRDALQQVSFTGFTGTPIELADANTRALLVNRSLRKYGYPPDKQEKATRTVLEQAEALSAE